MTILTQREGWFFTAPCRVTVPPSTGWWRACSRPPARGVHVLRDPTRGGLATTLNEIASASHAG